MSMMVSFVLSFFPRDVLDEILNLIESVSEDFPSYFCNGETLARVDCDGIAKSPVRAPHAAEDLAGIFQGHLNNLVQDKLLLIWPALR